MAPVSYLHAQLLPRRDLLGDGDGEPLFPAEPQAFSALAGEEAQRSDAHSHQVVLMHLLETLGDHGPHSLQSP